MMRYENVVIDNPLPPPKRFEYELIEKSIGAKLPDSFVRFLDAANGGTIDYELKLQLKEGITTISFSQIFSVNGTGPGAIIYEYANAKSRLHINPKFLPFARSGGDSLLFINLSKSGYEEIIAFIERSPSWTGVGHDSQLVFVASKFSDFLGKLYISDDYASTLLRDARNDGDRERFDLICEWLDAGSPGWRTRIESGILLE